MTNQPTDNEWKYEAFTEFMSEKNAQDFDKAVDLKTQIEFMLKYFIEAIDHNLPKPTEVVAPVDIDKIINDINKLYGIEEMIYQKEVKNIIKKHLKGTTPVEPINQEIDHSTKSNNLRVVNAMEYYRGDRCKSYQEGCGCCEARKEFDSLVTPINQERLSELIEHIIGDFFDRHRLSYSTFDVDNEYSKRKADELVPALREICWEYLGKSLQSSEEKVEGE